jgi:hypothetical protein
MLGYIYLLREREHIASQINVFKVGRTVQEPDTVISRIRNGYKKGSEIVCIMQCPVEKVVHVENTIIKAFSDKFPNHKDGKEHFYGDSIGMQQIIFECIKKVRSDDGGSALSNAFDPILYFLASYTQQENNFVETKYAYEWFADFRCFEHDYIIPDMPDNYSRTSFKLFRTGMKEIAAKTNQSAVSFTLTDKRLFITISWAAFNTYTKSLGYANYFNFCPP